MKKLFMGGSIAIVVALVLLTSPTFAAKNDLGTNWRVYNVKPDTASFWDINKFATSGAIPVQQFNSTTTGSFLVYALNNYNVDMTDKTLTATMNWTDGEYKTRAACPGAYVRFEFQDVTAGPYDVNDYWWSTGTNSLDLNTELTEGILSVSLADRTRWTNMAGQSATDEETVGYVDWNGNTAKDTPYDGFTKAMKNVKQVGLSLGSSCTYASGVALDGGVGTFTMSSFTITPQNLTP